MADIAEMVHAFDGVIEQCDTTAGALGTCVDRIDDARGSAQSTSDEREQSFGIGRQLSAEIKEILGLLAQTIDTLASATDVAFRTAEAVESTGEKCGRLVSNTEELASAFGSATTEATELQERIAAAFTLVGTNTGDAVKQRSQEVATGVEEAKQHAQLLNETAENTQGQLVAAKSQVDDCIGSLQQVRDSLQEARGAITGILEKVTETVQLIGTLQPPLDSITLDLGLQDEEARDYIVTVHGIAEDIDNYAGPFRAMM